MTLDLAPWRDTCSNCGSPIVWAMSPSGRIRVPVNLEPDDERGSLLLSAHGGQLYAGALGRNQAAGARERGRQLHLAHVADCPPVRPVQR